MVKRRKPEATSTPPPRKRSTSDSLSEIDLEHCDDTDFCNLENVTDITELLEISLNESEITLKLEDETPADTACRVNSIMLMTGITQDHEPSRNPTPPGCGPPPTNTMVRITSTTPGTKSLHWTWISSPDHIIPQHSR